MASKRKKSRPTRITDADVNNVGGGPQAPSRYAEDTLTEIQRYIEEGSEDTPDCLERKLDLSEGRNVECTTPLPDIQYETSAGPDISTDAIRSQMNRQLNEQELQTVGDQFVNMSNSRELQLWKHRVQQAARRNNESEDKRTLRLSLNRVRQACRRQNESDDARRLRLERLRERQAFRRKNESDEERKVRLERHRTQQADRRKNESDLARQVRLTLSRERQAARRRNESIEERELRLLKNRLRQIDRRKNEANKVSTQDQTMSVMSVLAAQEDPGERSIHEIFSNGDIPSNLKFHQLMKDELERVTEDVMPAMPSKKLTRKRSKPYEDEAPKYSCTMCKYVTNRSDHYKRHLLTHSADKPLKCTMCSYGTGRSDHYKRHLQRHGLSEPEIIATCFRNGLKLKNATPVGQSIENESLIDKPKENQDKANSVTAACIQESSSIVKVVKKFKCNQCSYSTDKSSHLTRHQNSHSKSYLAYCDKCNRSFRTPRNHKEHNCNDRQGQRCPKCMKIFVDHKAMLCHVVNKHSSEADGLLPVTAAFSQNRSVQGHTTAGNGAMMPTYSTNPVINVTRNGIDVQNINEPAAADDPDHKPMDLTLASRCENGDAASNLAEIKIRSGLAAISNDGLRPNVLRPDVPSDRGNMGCTKCGEWFNKLNEYSTHTCVS